MHAKALQKNLQEHPHTLRIFRLALFGLILLFENQGAVAQNQPQFQMSGSSEIEQTTRQWHFLPLRETGQPGFVAVQTEQLLLHNNGINRAIRLPEEYLETVFSREGQFFGVVSREEIPGSAHSNLLFEVFSAEGDRLYTLTRLHVRDDALPAFALADLNGAAVVGQNTTGVLEFYDNAGALKKQVELFKEPDYDLERVLMLDHSSDGQIAVMATKRRTAAGQTFQAAKTAVWLFRFDADGYERWRQTLPGSGSSVVALSPDGRYVFSNAYTVDVNGGMTKTSLLFDSNGTPLAEFDFLCKRVNFSPDSKFAILSDNREALLLDLRLHQIIKRHGASDPRDMIVAATVANGGSVSSVLWARLSYDKTSFVFQMPRLQILNHKGGLIQQIEFAGKIFQTPALRMSPDGSSILIGFDHAYEVYNIDR